MTVEQQIQAFEGNIDRTDLTPENIKMLLNTANTLQGMALRETEQPDILLKRLEIVERNLKNKLPDAEKIERLELEQAGTNEDKVLADIISWSKSEPLPERQNNYLLSTIEDYLFEFKELMSEPDYLTLTMALKRYFEVGRFALIEKPIQVKKTNVKRFGYALNELYRSQRNDKLPPEYLQFAKDNISIFANVAEKNLYKYFTTKV